MKCLYNNDNENHRSAVFRFIRRAIALLTGVFLTTAVSVHAGSWQNGVSLGGFNNVNIYTPDTNSPVGNGKSLLLVLHGCVQPISQYSTANLESAAEQYGMVIAVPDAMNKAGFSCWSYWQGTKSRSSGDYANLINLANTMKNDAGRGIDANQVYIAGLSSGAAFANTTACLAPDVFAGMGVSAGPSIGTSSNGALGPCESANVQQRCQQYAGSYTSHLQTQIASIAQGDQDTTVNLCYNTQNANGMAALYGVSQLAGTTTISEGSGHSAEQTLWQDGRVSMLWFSNVDHAWSGGAGASGSYISGNSINYAAYLGDYFSTNNPRIDRNQAPVISSMQLSSNAGYITVEGSASDDDGSVSLITINISDNDSYQASLTTTVNAQGVFTALSESLADGLYTVSAVATDDQGANGEASVGTVRIGPEPPPVAPVLSSLVVNVNAQCAQLSGEVVDENQNLASVTATFSNGTVNATVTGNQLSAERCSLPGGANSVVVTATDTGNLSASQSLSFAVDAGQTATLGDHISAGRLDYTNYANCYLEYGTAVFKLSEFSVGAQCQWKDNDASCVGPVVTCESSTPPPPDDCEQHTATNYSHKVAGRAYSTGNFLAPDYFAQGSNESMAGSTWGNTTLYSEDQTDWYVGSCP